MDTVDFLLHLFLNKTEGCWDWNSRKNHGGYGRLKWMGKIQLAHRVAAHLTKGFDLDSPLKVLHHCDNPACFNPDHLFIGTLQDNAIDCLKKNRHNMASRTHCKNGHEFTKENTVLIKNRSGRRCRICRSIELKRWRHRTKVSTSVSLTENMGSIPVDATKLA